MNLRSSGILMHLTSLPGLFGIGDMGPQAYRFADFLAQTHQRYWQILPLTPIDPDHNGSPYHSPSAFAGNPLLISPERLVQDGLLDAADLAAVPELPADRVDFSAVNAFKEKLLERAYDRFKARGRDAEYERFCRRHTGWLDDFVLFDTLKSYYGNVSWDQWPVKIRDRDAKALLAVQSELAEHLNLRRFVQYIFYSQWADLRRYCGQKQVRIIGDMPIYLPYESADVWRHPQFFKLGKNKRPRRVSGVPPDYFSDTGQLWGHPVYNWDGLQKKDYAWWIQRLEHQLGLFDVLRIDHFRGLVAYWEVSAAAKTAVNGKWMPVPVDDFFGKIAKHFAYLPIIAEDLGTITADVREVMCRYRLPGMRVLLFAFGEDFPDGSFLPHNHIRHCFVYTGTHDNNTVRGWFENEADKKAKKRWRSYIGRNVSAANISWEMIRLAMMSVADTVIIPMQDLLGLGADARMNDPSTTKGNWHWRLENDAITKPLTRRLRNMTETYGRS
ncbi:MalQ: 4-alpha-glucanotransferase [Desulfosarcina variabilis str. Montpellier]|uniref:4-alpha-glucanotransferase n=1 Tax=Desulfosarcina variabilis TaxID=2300 RepID=UPI003AFAE28A